MKHRRANHLKSYAAGRAWEPSVPLPKATVRAARAVLNEISTDRLGETGVSPKTQEQVLRFVDRVTNHDSTYVSVVPDEDGIAVLHWVAGPRSLQVDVSEAGPTYLWTRDGDGRTQVATTPAVIYHIAEGVLGLIAADVNRTNPAWRELVRKS